MVTLEVEVFPFAIIYFGFCARADLSDDDDALAPMYEKNVKNLPFFNMSGDHDRKRRWQLKMMDETKKKRSQHRV